MDIAPLPPFFRDYTPIHIPRTADEEYIWKHFTETKRANQGNGPIDITTIKCGVHDLDMIPASEVLRTGIMPDCVFLFNNKDAGDDLLIHKDGDKLHKAYIHALEHFLKFEQTDALSAEAIQRKVVEYSLQGMQKVWGTYSEKGKTIESNEDKHIAQNSPISIEEFGKNTLQCRYQAVIAAVIAERLQEYVHKPENRTNYYIFENYSYRHGHDTPGAHVAVINRFGVYEATFDNPENACRSTASPFSLKDFVIGNAPFITEKGDIYSVLAPISDEDTRMLQARNQGKNLHNNHANLTDEQLKKFCTTIEKLLPEKDKPYAESNAHQVALLQKLDTNHDRTLSIDELEKLNIKEAQNILKNLGTIEKIHVVNQKQGTEEGIEVTFAGGKKELFRLNISGDVASKEITK